MIGKLSVNPILKKDVLVNSRNSKMAMTITLINILFSFIVIMIFLINRGEMYQAYYANIASMFPVLAMCEIGIIGLIMPIITSTSVSGERERQTLDIMLTTPIKPFSIVAGKLLSAMVTTFMYVIATLPFLAVSFVVGGLEWTALFKYVVMILFIDIYIGSIGVFFSCVKRTSVSAAVSTIVTFAAVVLITYALGNAFESMMYNTVSDQSGYEFYMTGKAVFFAVNPVIWIVSAYSGITGDMSPMEGMTGYGRYSDFIVEHLGTICVCVNLCVSFVLIRLAACRLRSGIKKKKIKVQNDL